MLLRPITNSPKDLARVFCPAAVLFSPEAVVENPIAVLADPEASVKDPIAVLANPEAIAP